MTMGIGKLKPTIVKKATPFFMSGHAVHLRTKCHHFFSTVDYRIYGDLTFSGLYISCKFKALGYKVFSSLVNE